MSVNQAQPDVPAIDRLSRWAPVVLWMGVIFYMSTAGFSAEVTQGIIYPVLKFLFRHASEGFLQFTHHFIRKCAHFNEYGVLSWFVFRALAVRRPGMKTFAVVSLCFLYAGTDEYHQSFVSVRTASVLDVFIDTLGAGFMQSLFILHRKI